MRLAVLGIILVAASNVPVLAQPSDDAEIRKQLDGYSGTAQK